MSKLPNVAVIICNHNYAEYVCGAIESAARQDYKGEIRIVVVDDASTDDSILNIKKTFAKTVRGFSVENDITYSYYEVMGKELHLAESKFNIKQSAARNIAINEVWDWADYFAILDSDDEMMEGKISACIEKFQEFPNEIGSVHTDYIIENTTTGIRTLEVKPPYSKELLMRDCHLHSGGVISKKALEKVGLYDVDVVPKEDFLMWLKISDFFMCVHIPEPLVLVRVTPKNSTDAITTEHHERQYRLMAERYNEFRKLNHA